MIKNAKTKTVGSYVQRRKKTKSLCSRAVEKKGDSWENKIRLEMYRVTYEIASTREKGLRSLCKNKSILS